MLSWNGRCLRILRICENVRAHISAPFHCKCHSETWNFPAELWDQGAGFGIGDNESRPDVYWTWRAEEAVDANGLDIEEKNGDWLAFLGLQMESYGTERLGVGRVWGRVCHARKAPEWRHPVFTSWSVTCGMHDSMNNGGSRFSVNRAN